MYFDKKLRETIAEKFFDMGNLSWISLTIGFLFTNIKEKWLLFSIGILLGIGFYILGILIRGGKE
jgi:hypothetical protein